MNDEFILRQIKDWLQANHKTQSWLASEIGMSSPLLSQVLKGNRKLQTKYITLISATTGIPLEQLIGTEKADDKQPQLVLRGSLTSPESKKQLDQLLWDIQHYVNLEAISHAY